jgi:hypothetical protein
MWTGPLSGLKAAAPKPAVKCRSQAPHQCDLRVEAVGTAEMSTDVTRAEFDHLKARVDVVEREVERERPATRHILERTRRNGDDLAAVKGSTTWNVTWTVCVSISTGCGRSCRRSSRK